MAEGIDYFLRYLRAEPLSNEEDHWHQQFGKWAAANPQMRLDAQSCAASIFME